MMKREETDRALQAKSAAVQAFAADEITSEFYQDLVTALVDLETSPEERTLEDLPQDILDYVRTLDLEAAE